MRNLGGNRPCARSFAIPHANSSSEVSPYCSRFTNLTANAASPLTNMPANAEKVCLQICNELHSSEFDSFFLVGLVDKGLRSITLGLGNCQSYSFVSSEE
jgi:hypothetical protein